MSKEGENLATQRKERDEVNEPERTNQKSSCGVVVVRRTKCAKRFFDFASSGDALHTFECDLVGRKREEPFGSSRGERGHRGTLRATSRVASCVSDEVRPRGPGLRRCWAQNALRCLGGFAASSVGLCPGVSDGETLEKVTQEVADSSLDWSRSFFTGDEGVDTLRGRP